LSEPHRSLTRRFGPYIGLAAIFTGGVILNGATFLSFYNQLNVLGRISIIALPAVGMTMVIISAGIDLSVGSLVSLSSVITAMLLMERSWTRASGTAVPVFIAVAFLTGYALARMIVRRSDREPGLTRAVAIAGGLVLAALAALWCRAMVPAGFSTLAVLLIVPAFGLALGALNGIIIARGRIQPFIVTLGMMSAAVGLAKFIAGRGGQIHPVYYEAAGYEAAGTAHTAPASFDALSGHLSLFGFDLIPVTTLFFIIAVIVVGVVLTRLRFGRHLYAIGGNEEAARYSGVRVARVKIMVYALCGALSALAGVLYCAAYTQGKADAGATWELDAIAAVVIGGTSLMGGRGKVTGTLVGVLILGYLGNILNLQEVPSEVQDILKGVIIVGAVLIQEGTLTHWLRRPPGPGFSAPAAGEE
jgi:ribose/xylose/arabinose/galactoside ABC-type transport system permease subunit